jgi:hypothetical protein
MARQRRPSFDIAMTSSDVQAAEELSPTAVI